MPAALALSQNAVHGHEELRRVKTIATHVAVTDSTGKKQLGFQQYLDLLVSQCAETDSAKAAGTGRTKRRTVFNADITGTVYARLSRSS